MVYDLEYYSHPDKTLEVHSCGVVKKTNMFSSLPIAYFASLFHDLGKLNPNFQKKVKNKLVSGYTHHSYLSVLAFTRYCVENQNEIRKLLGTESLHINLIQIAVLIAYHHGNLPDLEYMLNDEELNKAQEFSEENYLPASEFLMHKLKFINNAFIVKKLDEKEKSLIKYRKDFHESIWQRNSLQYYTDTQFAFASLIHADKRDAGNNNSFQFQYLLSQSIKQIDYSLSQKFDQLDSAKNISELNRIRTKIRKEAVSNLSKYLLDGNERIFTLTSPTGSGKTFTLLALAREIQKQKGDLGIIYALPFLSITDQIQAIVTQDLNLDCMVVSSKAYNEKMQELEKQYEKNPTPENLSRLIQQNFAEQTFDHPFIITTFVQLFETFVSNKNAVLLKLPNFSNRIFLIDEVQALPPRLYIFFTAWLDHFCKKHNSYVILSTATMPKLDIPVKAIEILENSKNSRLLFKEYNSPQELLQVEKYFSENVFNRYKINIIGGEDFYLKNLAEHIQKQEKSCLVILNTISDTKNLYNLVKDTKNVILLNTHFIPKDRSNKIKQANTSLKQGEKIILISTQLIEAGVDIDFPVVYRDLCPLPSLIQSAGRGNRNKKISLGQIFFFQLKKEQGRNSSNSVYGGEDILFLNYCKNNIQDNIEESQLLKVQSGFFDFIKEKLTVGIFKDKQDKEINMIECVNKAEFSKLGDFSLINKYQFGEEYNYYIPENEQDFSYEEVVGLMKNSFSVSGYDERISYKIQIENQLKQLRKRVVTVRLKKDQNAPLRRNFEEYFGIRVLADLCLYSPETGLNLDAENLFL